MRTTIVIAVAVFAALSGCEAEMQTQGELTGAPSDVLAGADATRAPVPEGLSCDPGRRYAGFAGADLTADRGEDGLGRERARLKPFSALQSEFPRVLGNTPVGLTGAESTWGAVPARWYAEGSASAISLYASYRIAFQGCLTAVQPAKYATAPDALTAETECRAWARRFWSRAPMQPEVDTCVKVATVDAARDANPRRRWAYACAAVLTASDFLTF